MAAPAAPIAEPDAPFDAARTRERVVQVYAESLFRAATAAQQADAVGQELEQVVAGAVTGHPNVAQFLESTAIHKDAKLPVLAAAFEKNLSETFRKFIGVLNENGRLGLLPAVALEFRALQDKAAGRVRVRVTSAVPLNPEQAKKLEATLSERLKAKPTIEHVVDPNVLGGLVVQVGDTVYDTSVQTRLANLKSHLMASGTHG